MKIVCFLSDTGELPAKIRGLFEKGNWTMKAYSSTQPLEADVLLLFSPFLIENGWLTIDNLYASYFSKHKPELKIIQVGLIGFQSRSNYIHFFYPPENMEKFVEKCVSVSWWKPEFLGGIDLQRQLAVFMDGHGVDGFFKWFSYLNNFIKNIRYHLSVTGLYDITRAKAALSETEIADHSLQMLRRWEYFQKYLSRFPDERQIDYINTLVSQIDLDRLKNTPDSRFEFAVNEIFLTLKELNRMLDTFNKYLATEN